MFKTTIFGYPNFNSEATNAMGPIEVVEPFLAAVDQISNDSTNHHSGLLKNQVLNCRNIFVSFFYLGRVTEVNINLWSVLLVGKTDLLFMLKILLILIMDAIIFF